MHKPIRHQYTIRDLENMSGIKAHTIRMWEQRYQLFTPERGGNNVRSYTQDELRKWLNVASLYHLGYKISAIAEMNDQKLRDTVRKESASDLPHPVAQHAFMLAMLTFDTTLFHHTYDNLMALHPFREVFRQYLVPLLEQIGVMWQTETVTVAHEHFLSNLIRQKIILEAEKDRPASLIKTKRVYVLYLPENEIHELALLFAYYELQRLGHHAIYLGQSVPLQSLRDLHAAFTAITFITSFTVEPASDQVIPYLKEAGKLILRKGKDELRVSGRKILMLDKKPVLPGILYVHPGDPLVS